MRIAILALAMLAMPYFVGEAVAQSFVKQQEKINAAPVAQYANPYDQFGTPEQRANLKRVQAEMNASTTVSPEHIDAVPFWMVLYGWIVAAALAWALIYTVYSRSNRGHSAVEAPEPQRSNLEKETAPKLANAVHLALAAVFFFLFVATAVSAVNDIFGLGISQNEKGGTIISIFVMMMISYALCRRLPVRKARGFFIMFLPSIVFWLVFNTAYFSVFLIFLKAGLPTFLLVCFGYVTKFIVWMTPYLIYKKYLPVDKAS